MSTIHGIILASGPGRRQRALCNPALNRYALPKGMLPVGNRVLIDFSIEALKRLGLQQVHVGVGPRPLSEQLERLVTQREIYGIDIRTHAEESLLDTAGTVKYLLEHFISTEPDDTVCVLPCDTPHNIDLRPILAAHQQSNAAVTIAALPIKWSSSEWQARSFGTIQVAGMPDIKKLTDRNIFESKVRRFAQERKGETFVVAGFHEKQSREKSPSNIVNIGIYFFRAGFLMELAPQIKSPDDEHRFSDFGLHVFPCLADRVREFLDCRLSVSFIQQVEQGNFPFFAYLLDPDIYWRDVGNPHALLKVNMDVLAGRLDTQLSEAEGQYWFPTSWGWQGLDTSIDKNAKFTEPTTGRVSSIVGSHTVIESTSEIERSVVSDYATIAGKLTDVVCFPGSQTFTEAGPATTRIMVGRGVKLINSIVAGGNLRYEDAPRTIRDRLVYVTPDGGTAFDPL